MRFGKVKAHAGQACRVSSSMAGFSWFLANLHFHFYCSGPRFGVFTPS